MSAFFAHKISVIAGLFVVSLAVTAQGPDAGKPQTEQKVAALRQSLAQNQAALKQYSWTETTAISLKGEVKKTQQKECSYGPDGKVQKKLIGGGDQPKQEKEQDSGRRARRGGGAIKEK